MCRSIVTLRGEEPATDAEVRAAALQYIRKISGQRAPSRANQETFDQAVEEVARATQQLLDGLVMPPGSRPPAMAHSRVVARAKAAAAPTSDA
ncbi:MAG: DUF2277 domain-containing protein [Actinomycetota bacterium]|nr:DUF2277 domain-containing protein [Actinomycetota bacterium]